jgi:two-component sensor histidine kinase
MLVGSVLAMQRRAASSDDAKAALAAAADRVTTIARIHERLHGSDTADSVEFGAYLGDLARDIFSSSQPDLELVLEVERVELPSDRAAPLGLVAAELLMNALKHTRRGDVASVVRVEFRRLDGSLELVVADDGPGLPPEFDPARSRGLGMRLVLSLVAQLEGTLEARNVGGGARFEVRAPVGPRR